MSAAKLNTPRPPLRYFGGKAKLASWIVQHFPPHTTYVEPFAGGAAVLLTKPGSRMEVYNDVDAGVVNFFRLLRDQPAELIRVIEATPYSRAEFDLAHEPAGDPLEQARRFYVLAWQSMTGAGDRSPTTGWRRRRTETDRLSVTYEWIHHPQHLWRIAYRLKEVLLECDDALAVIKRYDAPGDVVLCGSPVCGCDPDERPPVSQ